MKNLILIVSVLIVMSFSALFADDSGGISPFIKINGGWNFWPAGAVLNSGGGLSFGGGLYFGDVQGLALGVDLEYLPYGNIIFTNSLFGNKLSANSSLSYLPLCVTLMNGSPSGWYEEVGAGLGINFYSGSMKYTGVTSSMTNNYSPSFLIKFGTGFNFLFTENIGLGIGIVDYAPLNGVFAQLTTIPVIIDDIINLSVNVTYKF